MRYCAVVAYDGSAYQGFQRLAQGLPSIQESLERALTAVIGVPTVVIGAARTDSAVHASGQVIAFDADWQGAEVALLRALNAHLPADIAIRRLSIAPDRFHPRFDAHSRIYRYQVYDAVPRHPLYDQRTWLIRHSLDLDLMQQAAAVLIGTHDFAAFGAPTQGESTERIVYRSEWLTEVLTDAIDGLAGRLLSYWIEASGFLQHMVRVLVGGLIAVGIGKLTVDAFIAIFHSADRSRSRFIAPPYALTLMAVTYPAVPGIPDAVRAAVPMSA